MQDFFHQQYVKLVWECIICCFSRTSTFQAQFLLRGAAFLFVPRNKPPKKWCFQIFVILTPSWGRFPIWRAYFSNGLVQPPASEKNPTKQNDLMGFVLIGSILRVPGCEFEKVTSCTVRPWNTFTYRNVRESQVKPIIWWQVHPWLGGVNPRHLWFKV